MNPAQQNKVDVSVSIEKSIHGESRFFFDFRIRVYTK